MIELYLQTYATYDENKLKPELTAEEHIQNKQTNKKNQDELV